MYFGKVITLLALCLAASRAYQTTYSGDKVFRITPNDSQQLALLSARVPYEIHRGSLDFWTYPQAVGVPVDIHVASSVQIAFEMFLRVNSFSYKILIDDFQHTIDLADAVNAKARENMELGDIVGTYVSQSEINKWLNDQCTKYHNITLCGSWGQTYQGRDMRYIRLGGPRQKAGSQTSPTRPPAVYIISGMHAREWLGPATVIWMINQMLTTYGKDAEVTNLVNSYDWFFEPVVNADGYEYSRNSDRNWRKTRTPVKDHPVCVGIDGNRDFDYKWASSGKDVCSETYAGPAALYDNVTNSINMFMVKQNKTQPGLAFFSLHTYSSLWMLPYGYAKHAYPPDYAELLRVGKIGVDALMKVHGTKWQIGNIVDLLYVATGNSADYFKGHGYAKYSYGMELRGNSFVEPPSQIVPSGQEVFSGIMAAVKAMKM